MLAAISYLLDKKMAPLHSSQQELCSKFTLFKHHVHSKCQQQDQRMTLLEEKLASSSNDHAIDAHARECINRVEQQRKLLSIGIASGSQSSNSRDAVRDENTRGDARISSLQS